MRNLSRMAAIVRPACSPKYTCHYRHGEALSLLPESKAGDDRAKAAKATIALRWYAGVTLSEAGQSVAEAGDRGSGRVACIVVNWNGFQDTLHCLQSLERQTYTALDVLVVDNGSTDASVEAIRSYLGQRQQDSPVAMSLLESTANLGFARGNNLGIRAALPARPGMIWLLNNDTECPPETLAHLLRTAEAAPDAGIVGSVLFYASDPKRVQAWGGGHAWPSVAYTTHYRAPRSLRPNDYLTFASVLLRPAMLDEVGLLSEDFFMYFEDVELCLRAQRSGWQMAVAGETAILHRVGGSSNGTRRPAMERAITVSGLLLIEKQGRWPAAGKAVFLAAKLLRRIVLGQWSAAVAVWSAASEVRSGRRTT